MRWGARSTTGTARRPTRTRRPGLRPVRLPAGSHVDRVGGRPGLQDVPCRRGHRRAVHRPGVLDVDGAPRGSHCPRACTGAAGAATSIPAPGPFLPPSTVPGGLGDTMTATISDLAPAQKLRVCVNVGGAGSSGAGGPGGGASGVSLGPDFSSPVVIGAGGGAASSQSALGAVRGGNAGWPAGVDGEGSQPGRGGTQSVAGGGGEPGSATTAAGPGGGGAGTDVYSGGGGGGWFGGGSGSDVSSIVVIGSSGGGGWTTAPPSRCSAAGAQAARVPLA